ncbi:MAG: peroxiredoxin family protein [Prosthecobacter sp.]|uniref:peroxiredoxin family protein n=1 Tax=Prosthecobacter sp. TaxID=1965333 RepID=UPI0038FF1842
MIRKATLLLLLLTLCACQSSLLAESAIDREILATTLVQKEHPAPDFTGQTTDGRSLTLSALKGKVVVLYFFSTKSVPACISEMKYLEREICQKLNDREDFQLIAIGRDHTREELVNIAGENKLNFPLVPDPKQEIYARYFTKFTPRTVVVRKDGSIAYLVSGHHEFDGIIRLQAVLTRELAMKTP